MIITLTLNPSLDRTIEVPVLKRGAVIRVTNGRLDPGGKGVNVARALLANGVATHAVLPVGGTTGQQLVELLRAEGVPMTAVAVHAPTRSNVTISEPDGSTTKINEVGGPLSAADIDKLAQAVLNVASPSDWVVASGSLPFGVPDDVYAMLTERFRAAELRVVVDTSGPALSAALVAHPTLIKPNREELSEAVGWEVLSIADTIAAARTLRQRGAAIVLASLGPDGAALIEDDGISLGECAVSEPKSSVGAGDCLLAGFLAGGATGATALANALCWAAAAVEMPGSAMPTPAAIATCRAFVSTNIDSSRTLSLSS